MNNSNMEALATLMSDRMKNTVNASSQIKIDLGRINGSMALVPDNFLVPIPKGDYLVNLMLTGDMVTSKTEHTHSGGQHEQEGGSGAHTHTGGEHSHKLPDSHRGLKPGDRVLIAWCGNEAVVIAIVIPS